MNDGESLPETYKKKENNHRIAITDRPTFLKGFLIGLLIFILLTILASALFSDCSLSALLGLSACADFPLIFFEQGGFAYHSDFKMPIFILDLVLGIGFGILPDFYNKKTNS